MTVSHMPPRMTLRPLAAANEAELLIYGDIGENWWGGESVTAKAVVDQLATQAAGAELIHVRINSYGGSVADGIAIYNALKAHRAAVRVQVDGVAVSSGSLIAMAGDEVVMPATAVMMVHAPWGVAQGNAVDMREMAEVLDTYAAAMAEAYAAKTGKPHAEMLALLADGKDHWFTAREAVEFGLADSVAGESSGTEGDTPSPSAAQPGLARFLHTAPQQIAAALRVAAPTPKETSTMTTPAAASPADIQAQALAAVRERNDRIHAAVKDVLDVPGVRDIYEAALRDPSQSVEHVLGKCLAVQAAQVGPAATGMGRVEGGEDAREKFARGAEAALLARGNLAKRESGNEFNGLRLHEIAAKALEMSGTSTRGLSPDQIARKALASHTSSDFPLLLSSTAGKALRNAYEAHPTTYQQFCAVGSVSDFKASPRIQLGSFNSLDTIPEGGEYTYGTIGEESESITAVTKGKAIKLTRQMLVNDDLGGFLRRAQMLGRAAARTVNNDVLALLTSGSSNNGPTMSDGGQLFNATAVTSAGGHANYLAAGYAPTVTSIAAGRAAMRKQKDKGLRDALNIEPRILLAPVGLEDVAWAVLNSTADPASANSAKRNYVRDVASLTLITDPYLDGVLSTGWYLIADPNEVPLLEVAFLDGNSVPFIDDEIDFDSDAAKFKVRLDYGIAAIDWRAGWRTTGTGGS